VIRDDDSPARVLCHFEQNFVIINSNETYFDIIELANIIADL